jgi:hypothetical protein
LRIRKGKKYQEDGFKQLLGYLKSRNAERGYLLTFDFREKKEVKESWLDFHNQKIFEVIV